MDPSWAGASPRMRIAQSLAQVAQLNQWFLELWEGPIAFECPGASVEALNDLAKERLRRFPVLLADLKFEDQSFWVACASGQMVQGATEAVVAWAEFTRTLCTVAWQVAHDPGAPRFMLGMTGAVASIIDGMTLRQLDQAAAQYSGSLRPRWSDVSSFWPSLILSASVADESAWFEFRLHALRMLGRNLLRREPDSDKLPRRRAPL